MENYENLPWILSGVLIGLCLLRWAIIDQVSSVVGSVKDELKKEIDNNERINRHQYSAVWDAKKRIDKLADRFSHFTVALDRLRSRCYRIESETRKDSK